MSIKTFKIYRLSYIYTLLYIGTCAKPIKPTFWDGDFIHLTQKVTIFKKKVAIL